MAISRIISIDYLIQLDSDALEFNCSINQKSDYHQRSQKNVEKGIFFPSKIELRDVDRVQNERDQPY